MSDKIRHKDKNIALHDIQGGEKKVMTKFNKKMINVLATATLVAGVAAPVATLVAPTAIHAAGSGSVTATNVPTVNANSTSALGSVRFTIPENSTLNTNDSVAIQLPYDMPTTTENKSTVTASTYNTFGGSTYDFSAFPISGSGNGIGLTKVANLNEKDFRAQVVDKDRIIVTYVGPTKEIVGDPAIFTLRLGAQKVKSGDSGPVSVSFDAPTTSVFPAGTVTVANVSDSKKVDLAFTSLDTANDNFSPKIVLSEPTAGTFDTSTEVKVKLPTGYKWSSFDKDDKLARIYGDADLNSLKFDPSQDSGRTLVITYTGTTPSKTATKFEIPYNFVVNDSSKVKLGDIIATVSGRSTTNISSGKIGTYGDYSSTVNATDAPTIAAGKNEQDVADVTIAESISQSLVNGRSLELTLPEGAAWQDVYSGKGDAPGGKTVITDRGVRLDFAGYTGTDRRTAKYKVTTTSSKDPARLKFEKMQVALASDFTGDLKVTVGGNAGITGSVVIGKVVAPVTAAASSKPNVIIGATNQVASTFTVTEGKKGALETGNVVLELPTGVTFTSVPTVKVTSGDVAISNVRLSANDSRVLFTVDADSNTASTITVSGVALSVDRTVAAGDINLKVSGSSVAETKGYLTWNNAAAKAAIASVATPAPTDKSTTTTFTINSTTYVVDGKTRTADVAPYIENSRTYLPVRYVADALGVTGSNIMFDKATSTVTLIRGDRVAQIKLNTNQLIINGSVIRMDVKAVTKNNRTVLPISWVAQALGATITYDATAKTVTVSQK